MCWKHPQSKKNHENPWKSDELQNPVDEKNDAFSCNVSSALPPGACGTKKHHSPHPPSVVDPQHNNPRPKALIPITNIELIWSSVLKSYQIQSEFVWQRFCPSWPCQPRVTKEPSFGGMLLAAIKCATVPATPQHAPPKASSASSGHQRVQKGFGMAHTNLE